MARERSLTVTGLLTLAFAALIIGHLLLKYYMPNVAVGGVGLLLVAAIFYYVLIARRDIFGFIILIYVCSHFSYADNQGGLWNLMAFGAMTLWLLMGKLRNEFRKNDYLMAVLLITLVLFNFLGWVVENPMPAVPRLLGIAVFLGYILIFYQASNLVITKERFRIFLAVTFFMLFYEVMVDLIQRYMLLSLNTPLIGTYSETGGELTYKNTNAWGTLRNFELMGEYGVLMTCLLIPLLSSSLSQIELRFSSNKIVVMIFSCLAIILLATNRSSVVLMVLSIAVYYIIFTLRIFSSVDRVGRQLKFVLVIALLIPTIGAYIGLDTMKRKFSTVTGSEITLSGVISGKDINRGELINQGLRRLDAESWFIGYGFGVPRSNRWAWFGTDPGANVIGVADYHSLYLTLPELYGWTGALAFLVMILVTAFRSIAASLRYRNRKSFLLVLSLGFGMFWCVFLANEYKITMLRNPNYHMLFWIWLALSNAVIKTIHSEMRLASTPASPAHLITNPEVTR